MGHFAGRHFQNFQGVDSMSQNQGVRDKGSLEVSWLPLGGLIKITDWSRQTQRCGLNPLSGSCVCVCVHMYYSTRMEVCVPGTILRSLGPPCISETGPCPGLKLTRQTWLPGHWVLGSVHFCLLGAGITSSHCHIHFYVDSGIELRFLTLAKQAFLPTSYLSRPHFL